MTAEISESLTRYPFHDAKLIYIPKPIAEDIVICPEPEVATNELFRNRMGVIVRFIPQQTLRELLKQAGYL